MHTFTKITVIGLMGQVAVARPHNPNPIAGLNGNSNGNSVQPAVVPSAHDAGMFGALLDKVGEITAQQKNKNTSFNAGNETVSKRGTDDPVVSKVKDEEDEEDEEDATKTVYVSYVTASSTVTASPDRDSIVKDIFVDLPKAALKELFDKRDEEEDQTVSSSSSTKETANETSINDEVTETASSEAEPSATGVVDLLWNKLGSVAKTDNGTAFSAGKVFVNDTSAKETSTQSEPTESDSPEAEPSATGVFGLFLDKIGSIVKANNATTANDTSAEETPTAEEATTSQASALLRLKEKLESMADSQSTTSSTSAEVASPTAAPKKTSDDDFSFRDLLAKVDPKDTKIYSKDEKEKREIQGATKVFVGPSETIIEEAIAIATGSVTGTTTEYTVETTVPAATVVEAAKAATTKPNVTINKPNKQKSGAVEKRGQHDQQWADYYNKAGAYAGLDYEPYQYLDQYNQKLPENERLHNLPVQEFKPVEKPQPEHKPEPFHEEKPEHAPKPQDEQPIIIPAPQRPCPNKAPKPEEHKPEHIPMEGQEGQDGEYEDFVMFVPKDQSNGAKPYMVPSSEYNPDSPPKRLPPGVNPPPPPINRGPKPEFVQEPPKEEFVEEVPKEEFAEQIQVPQQDGSVPIQEGQYIPAGPPGAALDQTLPQWFPVRPGRPVKRAEIEERESFKKAPSTFGDGRSGDSSSPTYEQLEDKLAHLVPPKEATVERGDLNAKEEGDDEEVKKGPEGFFKGQGRTGHPNENESKFVQRRDLADFLDNGELQGRPSHGSSLMDFISSYENRFGGSRPSYAPKGYETKGYEPHQPEYYPECRYPERPCPGYEYSHYPYPQPEQRPYDSSYGPYSPYEHPEPEYHPGQHYSHHEPECHACGPHNDAYSHYPEHPYHYPQHQPPQYNYEPAHEPQGPCPPPCHHPQAQYAPEHECYGCEQADPYSPAETFEPAPEVPYYQPEVPYHQPEAPYQPEAPQQPETPYQPEASYQPVERNPEPQEPQYHEKPCPACEQAAPQPQPQAPVEEPCRACQQPSEPAPQPQPESQCAEPPCNGPNYQEPQVPQDGSHTPESVASQPYPATHSEDAPCYNDGSYCPEGSDKPQYPEHELAAPKPPHPWHFPQPGSEQRPEQHPEPAPEPQHQPQPEPECHECQQAAEVAPQTYRPSPEVPYEQPAPEAPYQQAGTEVPYQHPAPEPQGCPCEQNGQPQGPDGDSCAC